MALAVDAEVSLRLAHIEKVLFEIHCAVVGKVKASCPRAQDLPVSASKRRRFRATRTRNRLWQASVATKEDITKEDPIKEDVDILDVTTPWQTIDCQAASFCRTDEVLHQHWEVCEIEDWVRLTIRAANEAAMTATSRKAALEDRMAVINRRWQQALAHIPTHLQQPIREILNEPFESK